MIEDGDRIAVGVSGGKDSVLLLNALKSLQYFYPKKFELEAVTLTMGIGDFDISPITELCNKINVNYTVEETQIGKIVFDIRKEKNPCALCANLKRGALHNVAKRLNCNKVALGHHKDDVIETLLLSTFYEGRFNTFSPVTYLEKKDLFLIRPLIYTPEYEIKKFVTTNELPIVPSPCSADGNTKRQYVKELLSKLQSENKFAKSNLFGAIKRSHINNW